MFNRWVCFLINSITSLLYKREYKRFINIDSVERVQREKLLQLIRKNENTEYGKKFNFSLIDSISKYQKTVPLSTYEDYSEYIEKIKNGEINILTKEKVLLLEPTSGSTSASKYIPYTDSLKKEFQSALKPWIYNLYNTYGAVKWGKSYWSITPVNQDIQFTTGGLSIGFEEDSEYFGFFERKLFDKIFAVEGSVAKLKNMDEFYYKTCVQLLMTSNLTLISVWNPTFLLLILEYIDKNADKLYDDLLLKDRTRAIELKEFISNRDYKSIWKQLKVISCWCDGNSQKYCNKIKNFFPSVNIQPKGLLATEGVVSFPFVGEDGARLSLHSHFYEFQSVKDEKIYLSHEIIKGEEYSVIITTSGGLYRYLLNDIIQVTGTTGEFPLMKFKGKKDKVSDLFGEKLNENFIIDLMEKTNINPDFYMIAPEVDRYILYIKADNIPDTIDDMLRENFHYDYCRKLGQLKKLKIFKLTGNPELEYIEGCVKKGQKMGDIKTAALSLHDGWDKVFMGEYI